jgi:hypothetical protein
VPDLWWALPATNRCMVSLQVVLLSAPTSLASIMAIGPHAQHAAVTHAGGSSEVGQREHMVRLGIHRKCWSEFLCLGDYLPRPAVPSGGGCPVGCARRPTPLRRPPPLAPRRRARGRSPIGYRAARCQTVWHHARRLLAGISRSWACQCQAICSLACVRGEVGATDHNLRSAWSRTTRMAVGSSNGRS